MPSKTARRRAVAAAGLAESARLFYPERTAQFPCPTCLDWVQLASRSKITEAHIIPESAGGRERTVLCHGCNSGFGSRRDRWFAEYLRLSRLDNPTILHATEQRGFFHVGGVRVSGCYAITDAGSIEFVIWEKHTSRAALEALPNQVEETITRALFPPGPLYERRRRLSVTVPPPPILDNEDLALIGFLTAGYLLWFRELGYTWALQAHLDIVREQIQTETLTILPRSFSAALPTHLRNGQWIGFGRINGELALLAGMEERIVLFPPADAPDFYEKLPRKTLHGARLEILGRVRFGPRHVRGGPKAVLYDNRFVVCPDVFFKGRHPLIVVPVSDGPLQVMYPVSAADFDELKRRYPDRGMTLKGSINVPLTDTAR